MKVYKIAVIPGDGTGPEVTAEAVKVLKAAADKFNFKAELTEFDFGGERYMRTGETLPDSAVEELRQFDSILLGAIGQDRLGRRRRPMPRGVRARERPVMLHQAFKRLPGQIEAVKSDVALLEHG